MIGKALSSTILGIEAFPVEVEAHLGGGKPNIRIVGLPDGSLRESRERVRCAIWNTGFQLPDGEVVVSLAPADLPKSGSGFDLAIALAVLACARKIDGSLLAGRLFLAELALDGQLKGVTGTLSTTILCRKLGGIKLVVAPEGHGQGGLVPGVTVESASSLLEIVRALSGDNVLKSETGDGRRTEIWKGPTIGDVKGQHAAKRALELSAAGGHNLLLVGPPGSGKSMLAERFSSLLPALSSDETLEILRIHECSNDGIRGNSTTVQRPFRAPHHSTSLAGLIGGGPGPKPGEISLAHKGVLFLDELPEFKRDALESLRQPMETRKVLLSRANRRLVFPADFTLLAAMNPCPCGKRGLIREECRCTPPQVQRYLSRISGPILDRIDLQLWVKPVESIELFSEATEDPTESMRLRVVAAHKLQRERNHGRLNSRVSGRELQKLFTLDDAGTEILRRAVEKLQLSGRAYSRTLKLARTIADLDGGENILASHVSEALSYRINLAM